MRLRREFDGQPSIEHLNRLMNILLDHFDYSIKDIKSYDELTNEEKQIISKEEFDYLVEDGD